MGALQVKGVPDDLHAALRQRAADEGLDLQSYVLQVLRRDLALPSQREWLADLARQPDAEGLPAAAAVLGEARRERDEHLGRRDDRD